MKLGSREYLAEVKKRCGTDTRYLELIPGEGEESYTLVLEAEPDKGVSETLTVGFMVGYGRFAEIWEGERSTDYSLIGPYKTWVDILCGKLSPNVAITTRMLKFSGSLLQLLKGAHSTLRFVEILQSIPTEFEGSYAECNFDGKTLS